MDDTPEANLKNNKKPSKSKNNYEAIPIESLGFKAKVYYDIYESVPRKSYKTYSKYDIERRKQNFRARLTYVIDPHQHEENGNFVCTKRSEWKKINYVIYRTRDQLFCCICLNKHFVAPQMLFCGHVFCWHCIFMHYEKSLKATSCPICNQIFQLDEIRMCKIIILTSLKEGDNIKLSLKVRKAGFGQQRIYNPKTLQEQTNFSRIIRMRANAVVQKFIQQKNQIELQLKTSNDEEDVKNFIVKVLSKCQLKIQKFQNMANQKGHHLKLYKHQKLINGVVHRVLQTQESKQKLVNFYQQQTGRFIYLHPICQKYLRKNFHQDCLPYSLQETILLKQQIQYSFENMKKYKHLNHLTQNQEFDYVVIKMNQFIDTKLLTQFQRQIALYKEKMDIVLKLQAEEAQKLKLRYQKQHSYLKQLRKMEECSYYDINVPTNMDPSQIHDTNLFPSLIQHTKSQGMESNLKQQQNLDNFNTRTKSQIFQQQKQKLFPIGQNNKKKSTKYKHKEEDFPGLDLAIQNSINQLQLKKQPINQSIQHQSYQIQKVSNNILKNTEQNFPDLESLNRNIQKSQQKNVIFENKKKESQKQVQPIVNSNTILFSKGKKSNKEEQQDQQNPIKIKGKKRKKQKFIDMTHQFFRNDEEQQY